MIDWIFVGWVTATVGVTWLIVGWLYDWDKEDKDIGATELGFVTEIWFEDDWATGWGAGWATGWAIGRGVDWATGWTIDDKETGVIEFELLTNPWLDEVSTGRAIPWSGTAAIEFGLLLTVKIWLGAAWEETLWLVAALETGTIEFIEFE